MTFYQSPLCDQHIKLQILSFLTKSCTVSNVAWDLIKNHAFLAWLAGLSADNMMSTVQQGAVEEALSTLLSTLIHTLIVLYNKTKHQMVAAEVCLPPMLTAEIMLTLRSFKQNFRFIGSTEVHEKLKDITSLVSELAGKAKEMCATKGYFNPIPDSLVH